MRLYSTRNIGRTIFGRGILCVSLLFFLVATAFGQQTWTKASGVTVTDSLLGVCYGNSQWVCVGASTTILTSSDAATWTKKPAGGAAGVTLTGVVWANDKFIAVGSGGTILTSADGTTWASQTSGTTKTLSAVAANGSLIVAVGDSGTILTSTNGTSWTKQTSGTSLFLQGAAWGNGKFFAVGGSPWPNGIDGIILYSSNGTSWTVAKDKYPIYLRSTAVGPTKFVTVGQFEGGSGDPSSIVLSNDGVTWTDELKTLVEDRFSLFQWLYGITYGQGRFVTVGSNGTVMYSIDGLRQDSVGLVFQRVIPDPVSADLNAVAFGSGKYVAVGNSGTIISSPATGKAGVGDSRKRLSGFTGNRSSVCGNEVFDLKGRLVVRLPGGTQLKELATSRHLSQARYVLANRNGLESVGRATGISW